MHVHAGMLRAKTTIATSQAAREQSACHAGGAGELEGIAANAARVAVRKLHVRRHRARAAAAAVGHAAHALLNRM